MGGQRVWEPGGGVPAAVVPPSPTAEERAKLDAVWGSIYRRVFRMGLSTLSRWRARRRGCYGRVWGLWGCSRVDDSYGACYSTSITNAGESA